MSETESAYDLEFTKYFEKGFNIHPIKGRTKVPGRFNPKTKKVDLLTGWANPGREILRPPQPQCGIGILLGPQPNGIVLVAIDWDDNLIANAALEKFPVVLTKWGQRGFTSFYQSKEPVASRKFIAKRDDKDVTLAEILCLGRQTVLPPTIHPTSEKPYVWDSYSLADLPINELPEFSL